MENKVLLLDDLGKKYGETHVYYNLKTPAEAIKALLVNFQGLDQWLLDSQKDGVAYKIKVGEEKIYKDNIDDLALPFTDKNVFSIRPVIQGSGRGFTRFLTGALILGAGFLAGGGFFGSAIAKNLGAISFVKQMGFIMALGGVAEMLSPQPTLPDMNQALISDNFPPFSTYSPKAMSSCIKSSFSRPTFISYEPILTSIIISDFSL